MRLSPVLVTVVAMTAPFASLLSANAQTPKSSNSNQTAEVLKPAEEQEHEVVGVFPASAPMAEPEVVVPSSTETSTTTQALNSFQQTAQALKPSNQQQNQQHK